MHIKTIYMYERIGNHMATCPGRAVCLQIKSRMHNLQINVRHCQTYWTSCQGEGRLFMNTAFVLWTSERNLLGISRLLPPCPIHIYCSEIQEKRRMACHEYIRWYENSEEKKLLMRLLIFFCQSSFCVFWCEVFRCLFDTKYVVNGWCTQQNHATGFRD